MKSKTCPHCGHSFIGPMSHCPTCDLAYRPIQPKSRSASSLVYPLVFAVLLIFIFFQSQSPSPPLVSTAKYAQGSHGTAKDVVDPLSQPLLAASLPMSSVELGKRLVKGNYIFDLFQNKYPQKYFFVMGLGTPTPKLVLLIPPIEWEILSNSDRLNLGLSLRTKPAEIRKAPDDAVYPTPKDAPAYPMLLRNVEKVCDECWTVMVGRPSPNGGIYMDRTVLSGDAAWDRDPDHRGQKFSDLVAIVTSSAQTK